MATLGLRTFDDMVGQMQMLDRRKLVEHWKAKGLDFSKLFTKPPAEKGTNIYKCEPQDHKIKDILDRKLISEAQAALDRGAPVRLQSVIHNTDRACGGMASPSTTMDVVGVTCSAFGSGFFGGGARELSTGACS